MLPLWRKLNGRVLTKFGLGTVVRPDQSVRHMAASNLQSSSQSKAPRPYPERKSMPVVSCKSCHFIAIFLCAIAGYSTAANAQPFAYVSNVSGNVVTVVNP